MQQSDRALLLQDLEASIRSRKRENQAVLVDPMQFGTPQPAPNVICFHYRITERHRAYLMAWLKAGKRMGLHDADIAPPLPADPRQQAGFVLIWVRENPHPAYRVVPEGRSWAVIDELRDHRLGRFQTFTGALNFIRPALRIETAIAG